MPRQYEAIRDSFTSSGMDLKAAKTRAAKIFIAKGKGGSRSSRAKSLHSDSQPSKETMKHVVSGYSAHVKKKRGMK
jgi:hypothetical protein